MNADNLVYVEGIVAARTAKAIQYRVGRGAAAVGVWVPLSILNSMTTARNVGDEGWFVVPRWFAVKQKITRFAV